jgi:hypothetical protein
MEQRISHNWNKVLKWLLKATDDKSERLHVIHVGDKWTVATDTYRIHFAEGKPGWPQIGSTIEPGDWLFEPFRAEADSVFPVSQVVNYPDVMKVLPDDHIAEITVDGGFLLDALGPMRNCLVKLRINMDFPHMLEMFGEVGGQRVYALIAGHKGSASEWRPEQTDRKETE